MGAHFEALDEGVLVAPLDSRYTQVGFNIISVQVCNYAQLSHFEFLVRIASDVEWMKSNLKSQS